MSSGKNHKYAVHTKEHQLMNLTESKPNIIWFVLDGPSNLETGHCTGRKQTRPGTVLMANK